VAQNLDHIRNRGHEHAPRRRVDLVDGLAAPNSEFEDLVPGRDVAGAEHAVPDEQLVAQVLVPVLDLHAVVQLMHVRADQIAVQRAEADRQMAVSQRVEDQDGADQGRIGEHDQNVGVGQSVEEPRQTGGNADDQHPPDCVHLVAQGVTARGRQGRQEGRGMVDLVQFPERRNLVIEVMSPELGEILGDEDQNRPDGQVDVAGR